MGAQAMSTDTTPTPWHVGGHPCDGSGSDWREILTNSLPYQPHFIATALKADAELIVQAVNERAQLLAERDALKAALEMVIEHGQLGNHAHWDMSMERGAGCPVCINQRNVLDSIRAALAQGRDKPLDR